MKSPPFYGKRELFIICINLRKKKNISNISTRSPKILFQYLFFHKKTTMFLFISHTYIHSKYNACTHLILTLKCYELLLLNFFPVFRLSINCFILQYRFRVDKLINILESADRTPLQRNPLFIIYFCLN